MVVKADDLSVVKHLGDPVMVMYVGKIMKVMAPDDLRGDPQPANLRARSVPLPDRPHEPAISLLALARDVPLLEPPRWGGLIRSRSARLSSAGGGQMSLVPGAEYRIACHSRALLTDTEIDRAPASVAG